MKKILLALALLSGTATATADEQMITAVQPTYACGDAANLDGISKKAADYFKRGDMKTGQQLLDQSEEAGICHKISAGDHLYFVGRNDKKKITLAYMPVGVMRFAVWVYTDSFMY